MGINKLGSNQEITRHATWVTPNFGVIQLSAVGEITNAVSVAPLITGQQRPSGQKQPVDVTCSLPLERREDVAKIESMKAQAEAGAVGYLIEGSSMQYERVDGSAGFTVTMEEAWVHTTTYPATDANATGDGSMYTFTMTVWGAEQLPGS